MARMRHRLDAPVLVGVGAAFDFHAGLVPQAPDALQRLGLEWAFRLVQEPRRLWRRYLRYNPRFVLGFLRQYVAPPAGPPGVKRLVPALGSSPRSLAGAAPARADVYDDNPAAASRGPGDMAVLARGADGAIYERHLAGGAWTPWASIGGAGVVRPGARRLRRASPRVRRRHGLRRLRERAARRRLVGLEVARRRRRRSAPAAIARRGTDYLDLAVRGTDNADPPPHVRARARAGRRGRASAATSRARRR